MACQTKSQYPLQWKTFNEKWIGHEKQKIKTPKFTIEPQF